MNDGPRTRGCDCSMRAARVASCRLYEAPDSHCQQFIRAIADDNVVRFAAMKFRKLFPQRLRRRIRIQPQPLIGCSFNRLQNRARWRVWVFVSVQLDQTLDLWLFARNVRVQVSHQRADEGGWRSHVITRRASLAEFRPKDHARRALRGRQTCSPRPVLS